MLVGRETKTGRIRRIPLRKALQKELLGRVEKLVPFSSAGIRSFARIVLRESGVVRFRANRLRHKSRNSWKNDKKTVAARVQKAV
jgi:hypothetical protein